MLKIRGIQFDYFIFLVSSRERGRCHHEQNILFIWKGKYCGNKVGISLEKNSVDFMNSTIQTFAIWITSLIYPNIKLLRKNLSTAEHILSLFHSPP